MLIGGTLRPASDGGVLETPNPSTGQVLAAIPEATAAASSRCCWRRRSGSGDRRPSVARPGDHRAEPASLGTPTRVLGMLRFSKYHADRW